MQASATSATCHGICCGCSRKTSSARPRDGARSSLQMPIFMVFERGSSTARMRAVPPTCHAGRQASPEWPLGGARNRHTPSRRSLRRAAPAAAGVDKRPQRIGRIRRQYAHVARRGDRHQAVVHVVLAHRPHFTSPTFSPSSSTSHSEASALSFRLPVALLAHQLLLAPAAHRHGLLQVDVVLRQDNAALARNNAHRWWNCF